MIFLQAYLYLDILFTILALPILIMYCFIPNKSISGGLREWFNEY